MRQIIVSISLLLATVTGAALADWEAGVAAFKKQDYQAAVREFRQVVEQSPDAHSAHYMLGLSLGRLGRAEEALDYLRRAYELNPNDLSTKIALAQAYFGIRRYGDVTKLLDGVIDVQLDQNRQRRLYQMRAVSREQTGDQSGALADYARLARLAPDDVQILLRYGVLLANAANRIEAIEVLDRAHRAEPGNPHVLRTYGQLLKQQAGLERDPEAKRQIYIRATDLARSLVLAEPTYESHLFACEAQLGAVLHSEAIESCQAAIAKKADQWLPLYYIGVAYSSQGQFAEALGALGRTAQLARDEDLKTVWKQIGFVYEKQKNYERAIEAYQRAGDSASLNRVVENQAISQHNVLVEEENERIEELRREAERLERELRALEENPNR